MIQIMEYLRNFGIIKCGHCHNLLLLLLLFLILCLLFRTTIQIRQLKLVRRLCMCEWKSLLYVGQTFAHNIQSWIVLPEMPYCFNLASSPFSPNSVCAFVSKTITNLMYIIPHIQSDSTETRRAMIISDNYKLNKLMNKNKVHVLTRQLYNRFLFESSFLPKNKYAWDLSGEYMCVCVFVFVYTFWCEKWWLRLYVKHFNSLHISKVHSHFCWKWIKPFCQLKSWNFIFWNWSLVNDTLIIDVKSETWEMHNILFIPNPMRIFIPLQRMWCIGCVGAFIQLA